MQVYKKLFNFLSRYFNLTYFVAALVMLFIQPIQLSPKSVYSDSNVQKVISSDSALTRNNFELRGSAKERIQTEWLRILDLIEVSGQGWISQYTQQGFQYNVILDQAKKANLWACKKNCDTCSSGNSKFSAHPILGCGIKQNRFNELTILLLIHPCYLKEKQCKIENKIVDFEEHLARIALGLFGVPLSGDVAHKALKELSLANTKINSLSNRCTSWKYFSEQPFPSKEDTNFLYSSQHLVPLDEIWKTCGQTYLYRLRVDHYPDACKLIVKEAEFDRYLQLMFAGVQVDYVKCSSVCERATCLNVPRKGAKKFIQFQNQVRIIRTESKTLLSLASSACDGSKALEQRAFLKDLFVSLARDVSGINFFIDLNRCVDQFLKANPLGSLAGREKTIGPSSKEIEVPHLID